MNLKVSSVTPTFAVTKQQSFMDKLLFVKHFDFVKTVGQGFDVTLWGLGHRPARSFRK